MILNEIARSLLLGKGLRAIRKRIGFCYSTYLKGCSDRIKLSRESVHGRLVVAEGENRDGRYSRELELALVSGAP